MDVGRRIWGMGTNVFGLSRLSQPSYLFSLVHALGADPRLAIPGTPFTFKGPSTLGAHDGMTMPRVQKTRHNRHPLLAFAISSSNRSTSRNDQARSSSWALNRSMAASARNEAMRQCSLALANWARKRFGSAFIFGHHEQAEDRGIQAQEYGQVVGDHRRLGLSKNMSSTALG